MDADSDRTGGTHFSGVIYLRGGVAERQRKMTAIGRVDRNCVAFHDGYDEHRRAPAPAGCRANVVTAPSVAMLTLHKGPFSELRRSAGSINQPDFAATLKQR